MAEHEGEWEQRLLAAGVPANRVWNVIDDFRLEVGQVAETLGAEWAIDWEALAREFETRAKAAGLYPASSTAEEQ